MFLFSIFSVKSNHAILKMELKQNKSSVYKYLFAFILVFYCLVLTQFGFENFDSGYIPSFSWRILNGQDVYQDFIYKGPPVTLYFHAFFMYWLPVKGQFFYIRILSYLFFALQVFFTVSGFYNLYDFNTIKVDKWGLICVGFVVSLLNFSPYPWPTTDGLLFASVAFWLVSRLKSLSFFHLLLIAFFCILSALTKQSFYLIPLLFFFWIFVKHNPKKALIFVLQLILFLVFYLYFILSTTTLENFISQTTGETHLHDLFYSGIHNYIFISLEGFSLAVVLLALAGFAFMKFKKRSIQDLQPILKLISLFIFVTALLLCGFKKIELASRIAFDAAVIAVICTFIFHKKKLEEISPMLVALGIAWSCSISLGYQFPILFATGIILCFLVSIDLKLNSKYYFWIALPICCIAFSYNARPYRDDHIFLLKYDLETVSPKLKYIKTNRANFEKFTELKNLVAKYGENFIVAPNIPMANYLFNNQSELPADWIIETEVGRRQKLFIRLASDKKNYIFLEKSFLQHEEFMPEKPEDFSSISAFIYKKFNCIEQTKYFLIYNSLKKNEAVP